MFLFICVTPAASACCFSDRT